MPRLGLVTGTAGNVSARDGELILITASALPYEEMTVDDLVTLGPNGAVVAGEREPSSEWRVHVAVYAARSDARALVHAQRAGDGLEAESGEPLGRWLTAPYFAAAPTRSPRRWPLWATAMRCCWAATKCSRWAIRRPAPSRCAWRSRRPLAAPAELRDAAHSLRCPSWILGVCSSAFQTEL